MKKFWKKNKKIIIIVCFVLFIVIGNIVIIVGNNVNKGKHEVQAKKGELILNQVVCTYTDDKDYHYVVTLDFVENKIVTKTEETTWSGGDDLDCAYQTKRASVYNSIGGVSSSVDCNGNGGTRKVIFTFADLDEKEARVVESKYINQDGTFDINGYRNFKNNEGYACVVK